MSKVTITGLTKQFGQHRAVNELALTVDEGEFVSFLGPSGCGKTTTLRCIAGLESPTSGSISIGADTVVDAQRRVEVPPEKRHVGMVFQSYALWPHMTVFSNVAYPLRLAKVSKSEIRERVTDVLRMVGLEDYVQHRATALSGGQQQRVALARAVVARPRLVLFDEPLSNLDAKLRHSMRDQIRALHTTLGTTSLYVTHDQEEALAMSDRIVVMNKGRIEQVGAPSDLYERPLTKFVADFMGFQNIWSGLVVDEGPEFSRVRITGSDLDVRVRRAAGDSSLGSAVHVAFRAAQVRLTRRPNDGLENGVRGLVLSSSYLGSSANVLMDVNGLKLRMQLAEDETGRPRMPVPGERLDVYFSGSSAILLRDTESRRVDDGAEADVLGELSLGTNR